MYPADKEFERFFKQMELEISKSEGKGQKTAENSQNCGPKNIIVDRNNCINRGKEFQSQNFGPKSKICGPQFCPAITFSTPEGSDSTQNRPSTPKAELKPLPFTLRVEVFNPLTEEKHNEIMKEEPKKIVIKHDDSVSTSRAKDKGFQASHKKLQMICETDSLSALKVKKKWICCGRKRPSEEGLSHSLTLSPNLSPRLGIEAPASTPPASNVFFHHKFFLPFFSFFLLYHTLRTMLDLSLGGYLELTCICIAYSCYCF
jgi:hypothetical protein